MQLVLKPSSDKVLHTFIRAMYSDESCCPGDFGLTSSSICIVEQHDGCKECWREAVRNNLIVQDNCEEVNDNGK